MLIKSRNLPYNLSIKLLCSNTSVRGAHTHTHTHTHTFTHVRSKKWTAATVSYGVPQPPDRFLHVQYFLITFRKVGSKVGGSLSAVAFRGHGGGPPRGDFAPTSGSPVAPSRTCRLFPRRDSRSPHLSSVRASPLHPSAPPCTVSLLSLSLRSSTFSLPLSFPPPWFYSISLLYSSSSFSSSSSSSSSSSWFSSSCSCNVRPSLVKRAAHVCTTGSLFIFRYFRTAMGYTTTLCASHGESRTRCAVCVSAAAALSRVFSFSRMFPRFSRTWPWEQRVFDGLGLLSPVVGGDYSKKGKYRSGHSYWRTVITLRQEMYFW